MPMLQADKKKLAKEYLAHIDSAVNGVVLSYNALPVNELNSLRMDVAVAGGQLVAIKKRVFLKGIEGTYSGATLEDMQGSIMMLYSSNEEEPHAPLSVINNFKKKWKKEKKKFEVEYVGGRYDKEWKDKEYVGELAGLPSKEELIGKFLYMLNHPVSSFARVLQAIADKDGEQSGEAAEQAPAEEVAEEA